MVSDPIDTIISQQECRVFVPNRETAAINNGVALGKLAGRVTAVALTLYVISLIYRSGEELAALMLGSIVAIYASTSIVRDIQYGYSPWESVEWITVPPSELAAGERQRALRWTVALKLLLTIGAISGLAITFAAGFQMLGYVLLIGGLPALMLSLYRHYSNETRPWYPSVPSQPDQLQSTR